MKSEGVGLKSNGGLHQRWRYSMYICTVDVCCRLFTKTLVLHFILRNRSDSHTYSSGLGNCAFDSVI